MSGKIYKHNPIVRGYFSESENGSLSSLSELEFDLLNYIYLTVQRDLFKMSSEDVGDDNYCTMRYSNIKKAFGINSNSHRDIIKDAIDNLANRRIVMKNFKLPDGLIAVNYSIPVISGKSEEMAQDPDAFVVKLDKDLVRAITAKNKLGKPSNFTLVDIYATRSLSAPQAKRLYEHLLSMKQIRKDFSMDNKALCKLFGNNPNRGISTHTQSIKRAYKKVNALIKFEYSYDRSVQKIHFKIGE